MAAREGSGLSSGVAGSIPGGVRRRMSPGASYTPTPWPSTAQRRAKELGRECRLSDQVANGEESLLLLYVLVVMLFSLFKVAPVVTCTWSRGPASPCAPPTPPRGSTSAGSTSPSTRTRFKSTLTLGKFRYSYEGLHLTPCIP